MNWKKNQKRQRLGIVGWGVALFGTAILLPSEPMSAQNPPTIEQILGIQDLTRGELPAPRFPDLTPSTQGRTPLATNRTTNSVVANSRQDNSSNGPPGSTSNSHAGLWDDNDVPPFSNALSELLQGSHFHPNRLPPRTPNSTTVATGMIRSGGNPVPGGTQLGEYRNPLRNTGSSSARSTIGPPAGNLSIPRPVPQADNARPLVLSNQRSQSLLHNSQSMGRASSLDDGTIGLMTHHSDVDLDLPPPYEVVDTHSRATTRENSSVRSHDRPLSQVITSPNLPLQSGFHPDDFDEVANQSTDRNNRLSVEKFERLQQQFSAGVGENDRSEVTPASFDLNETRPIVDDTKRANARRSLQNDLRSDTAPRKLDSPVTKQTSQSNRSATEMGSNESLGESKPPVKLGASALLSDSLPNDSIRRTTERTRELRPTPLTKIPGTDTKLLDFPAYRSHLLQSPAEDRDTVMTRLTEANYWNQRGSYEQAAGLLEEMQFESLDDSQQWELAFQTMQAAVGLRHPLMFRQGFETVQDLWSNELQQKTPSQLELIYHDYFAAYNALLQPEPNYVAAADSFQNALRRIAERISTAPSWSQQRMTWIMVDCQCRLAQCVAFGPYRQGAASADQWFEEAGRYVKKLIDSGRADSLLRLIIVQRQIECYAQTGRFREIPPLLNYITTWEHQLFANNQREESRWVHQLVTENLLQSGLHALNHQQWTAATAWANQAVSRLEVRQSQRDWHTSERHNLATAYWLQGAVHFQTGNGKASKPLFDAAAAIWSNPADHTLRDPLGHGERLAIMAVAYWQQEQEQAAVTLGQEAVASIQDAIDRGTATADRLDIPAANLYEMMANAQDKQGDFATAGHQTVSYHESDLELELEAEQGPPSQDANVPLQEALEDPRTQAQIETVIPR